MGFAEGLVRGQQEPMGEREIGSAQISTGFGNYWPTNKVAEFVNHFDTIGIVVITDHN